jgi:phosphatidylglycerol:prolipoprotein diacylglycerol transferase
MVGSFDAMNINPVVFRLGTLELHAFTAAVLAAAVLGAALLLLAARRYQQHPLCWFDGGLGVLIGAVPGARVFHVLLEWPYFSAHLDQIAVLSGGGLDWHGAFLGGLIGGAAAARLRGVSLPRFLDVLALIFPLLGAAVWYGCSAAACAYGVEVRTLADFPAWLVTESPDVYGSLAPRIDLPQIGLTVSVLLYALLVLLSAFRRLRGVRLWFALAVYSLILFFLGGFRGDYVIRLLGLRADQVLDLAVFALSAALLITPHLSTSFPAVFRRFSSRRRARALQ